jgi:hypothetical protein
MPNVSKEYLKNAQCGESIAELETVFSEVTSYYFDREQ